jgi:hypothetical protein
MEIPANAGQKASGAVIPGAIGSAGHDTDATLLLLR